MALKLILFANVNKIWYALQKTSGTDMDFFINFGRTFSALDKKISHIDEIHQKVDSTKFSPPKLI